MAASGPAPGPRITLFVTVLSMFLMVALLVGTAVTVANYVEARKTAFKVAEEAFRATIGQINERRLAFFTPAFLILDVLPNAPSLQQADRPDEQITQLVLSAFKSSPQISAVYVGYQNGNYLQVLSISESEKAFVDRLGAPQLTRYAVQTIQSNDGGARTEIWTFLDSDRRQIGALAAHPATYDPRRRDWYREAFDKQNSIIRTPPYLFATTSQIGLTLAKTLAGGAGVVGADITLDRLMLYVRSVRAHDSHRFVAFDAENRLLAHYDPGQMVIRSGSGETETVRLATTADEADPVVRAALEAFIRDGPYQLAALDVEGVSYLATVVRQLGREGGVFFILYAAPLSDFQGTLIEAAKRSIPIALLAFLLIVPVIVYLARSISRPLTRLSTEAGLIQSFQLDDPIRMTSRVIEISRLIRSMSGMKSTIREVSKFVPKALVRDILESEDMVAVGGQTRRISILFTDVRDFTPMAEGMPPQHLMASMSEYFEDLASLIIARNGTVDKFIGDAIFAFWNAPLAVAHHEQAACAAALECHDASVRLNARWTARGMPAWHTRIGVHVGEAVLGNVGSSDRIDYTAIGNNVNVAARLEGLNKFYGTSILASEPIVDMCSGEFLFRRVDRIQPKGVGHALDIFELLGTIGGPEPFRTTAATLQLVRDWNGVHEIYANRDWLRALDALEAFADAYPQDVLAGIYLERVVAFILEPPSTTWDGTIHFSRK